jgi:hypothetical protein
MQRVRAIEPDGTEHLVPCAPGRRALLHSDCITSRERRQRLTPPSSPLRPRPVTSEETVLRLAHAVFVAETAVPVDGAPAAPAAAAPTAAGAAPDGSAADAPEAAYASAVEFMLKARAELEVRAVLGATAETAGRVLRPSGCALNPADASSSARRAALSRIASRCLTSSRTWSPTSSSPSPRCSGQGARKRVRFAVARPHSVACVAHTRLSACAPRHTARSAKVETLIADLAVRAQSKYTEARAL